jgi:hypothetical protein
MLSSGLIKALLVSGGAGLLAASLSLAMVLGKIGGSSYGVFVFKQLIFPAYFPFAAVAGEPNTTAFWLTFAAALIINVMLYMMLGIMVWLGLSYSRIFLFIPPVCICLYAFFLLR